MRTACLLAAVMLVACGDDDGPSDHAIDGGPSDECVDAKIPDADPGCAQLDQPYKFYTDGGLAPFRDVYTVSGSGAVKVDRLQDGPFLDAGLQASCTGSLGLCGSAPIAAAIRNVSALWSDGSTVYGADHRPTDGQVLIVERTSDGKKIAVGAPCSTATDCTAIPAAAAELQTVFEHMRTALAVRGTTDGGLAGSCSP